MKSTCAWCGQPARGFATIGDDRYCHDGSDYGENLPSCFQLASWDQSLGGRHELQDIVRLLLNLTEE